MRPVKWKQHSPALAAQAVIPQISKATDCALGTGSPFLRLSIIAAAPRRARALPMLCQIVEGQI